MDLQAKEREREREGKQRESEVGRERERESEREREGAITNSLLQKIQDLPLQVGNRVHSPLAWQLAALDTNGNSHCGGKSIIICQGQIIKVKIIQILRPKLWPNN